MPAQTAGRVGGSTFASKKAAVQTARKREPEVQQNHTVVVNNFASRPIIVAETVPFSYTPSFFPTSVVLPVFDANWIASVIALNILIVWLFSRKN